MPRILIVDDEAANMRALCDTLRERGYDTQGVTSGEAALDRLRLGPVDVLLTDVMMPGMDGVELLAQALKIDPQLIGVLMTGKGTVETAVAAMKAGAMDYVLKPVRLHAIVPVLARAMDIRRLRLENLELRDTVAVHELIEAISHTLDTRVLLQHIVDAAVAQVDGDEASVMLLSEDNAFLTVEAVRGSGRESLLGNRQRVGEGIAGQVALHRKCVVLHGEVAGPQPLPLHPRADIQSALSMPMVARDRLVGILNVNFTSKAGKFSPGQLKVLDIFMTAAATGIEAARLHESERRADARYRQVLDMTADAIISFDADQRVVTYNAAAERIFGWSREEAAGKSLDLFIAPEIASAHRRQVQAYALAANAAMPMQGRGPLPARRRDGSEFPAEISIAHATENGRDVYSAIVRDVTEAVRQRKKIARLNRIQVVLSGINSAIVRIHDRESLFREACRIAVQDGQFVMAWIGLVESVADKVRPVVWMGNDDGYLEDVGRALRADNADGGSVALALREKRTVVHNDIATDSQVAYRHQALSRGFRSMAILPLSVRDQAVGVIVFHAGEPSVFDQEEVRLLSDLAGDISFALELMDREAQLVYVAHHDVLTGLPNRVFFTECLEQRVHAARHDQAVFGVAILDLERFRHINESLGRSAGDEVLRHVARVLATSMGEAELLAHAGVDRFVVATRHADGGTEIGRIVEALLDTLHRQPFTVANETLRLGVRAGIAAFPSDGTGAESLYHNAEAALRAAKLSGQRSQFYAPTMNATVARTLRLENRMRGALEREEFVLHYQPKVELPSGRIVGVEALIRWLDPESGLVPPGQFIGLLEETGGIVQVGEWAMRHAACTAAQWCKRGFEPVRVAVNVSAVQLQRSDFVESVARAIKAAGDDGNLLDLEITESVIMTDVGETVRKLNEVRAMGVELAIDDFGTGYSSLAYIARLPVSTIKIDRAFIKDLSRDADHRVIVQSIISLTHSLHRKVVAEGVETQDQAQLLHVLHCNQGQGYLFGRPVPAAEIEKVLPLASRQ